MNTIFKKIGSWFKNEPEPPRLHRKWTWRDELKDTYKDWLPLAIIIFVVSLILLVIIIAGVRAEANIYYYGGLA